MAKRRFYAELYEALETELGLQPHDVEITITVPRVHWGIRGMSGDALDLNYRVEV